jgi:peptidylprolyl isomerase
MRRLTLILIACLGLVGAGCGGSDDDSSTSGGSTAASTEAAATEATTTDATTTEAPSNESSSAPKSDPGTKKKPPKVTVPKGVSPNKFAFRELETGTGATAKPGDKVTVQYVGAGYDSKVEFESTWESKPYSFTLGAGEVIPGWERGVPGMKEGGRRELIIPASLAYGAEGRPPVIGSNETLIFVIDLLAVE